MRAFLYLAVHQGEEPVLLAEKNHKLYTRTSEALQIDDGYPRKPMLLASNSPYLQEAYHA